MLEIPKEGGGKAGSGTDRTISSQQIMSNAKENNEKKMATRVLMS
jgi:hypothetical protein